MITITVETDEEEAAILEALKDGKIELGGQPFTIRRGHRSIGGRGTITVTHFAGGTPVGAGGGGGGSVSAMPTKGDTGQNHAVHHAHGPGESCNTACGIIGAGGGGASISGGASGGGPGGGWTGARP